MRGGKSDLKRNTLCYPGRVCLYSSTRCLALLALPTSKPAPRSNDMDRSKLLKGGTVVRGAQDDVRNSMPDAWAASSIKVP